ncbi:MAG: hypothetical protein JXA30_02080 [Deltaproteobacteria bacterium]|nr:hypothetical protein [Deltaproteobacteria bacterium]
MPKKMKKNSKNVRNLTLAICALTLGIPVAAAMVPSIYAFIVPMAIIIPFFTLSYLESEIFSCAEG